MNYKKLIKDRQIRQKIMKFLSFVPDKIMLKLQYRIKLGRTPNLKDAKRYTEKLQLYKLYYRNSDLGRCVDKLAVRQFVAERGFHNALPVLYGVYKRAEDIDYKNLPDKFVIKTNDGGGGDNVFICRDKTKLDKSKINRQINCWLNKKDANAGREWAYTQISQSIIIVEELLENETNPEAGLEDFKFFCFDGKPYCVQHDGERFIEHKRNFYDFDWNNLHVESDCNNFKEDSPKPHTLVKMLEMAEILSSGFPFVRVDLYSIRDKVYFGELTFYPWSGYVQFTPDEFDFTLGDQFDVSSFIPKR